MNTKGAAYFVAIALSYIYYKVTRITSAMIRNEGSGLIQTLDQPCRRRLFPVSVKPGVA
jgi:hypothetical protein